MDLPIDADRLQVRVCAASLTEIGHWWNVVDVCSPYWRYYVNTSAGASIRLSRGRLYPLPPGSVHLIPAWVRFGCVLEQPTEHLFAHFEVVGIPGALVREALPEPCSLPLVPHLAATAERMRMALKEGKWQRPSSLFAVKAAVDAALADLTAGLPDETTTRLFAPLRADSAVAPALTHIERNLGTPLTNADLARRCGFSSEHFVRRFRRDVGQTPAQYVLERRVAAAAQALAFDEEPIEAIAERLAFPDRYYFSRVFTRRMGVPPATYRRGHHRAR